MSRHATHAGSWYTNKRTDLDASLQSWLSSAASEYPEVPPINNLKAIIAPHAGYSYSGPAAGWAYCAIDPNAFDRVFVLGPSHKIYLPNCALTTCNSYSTPIGPLPIDTETTRELRATGKFTDMSLDVDEDEHSIEMHLPYIRKVFQDKDIKIVPILVGATSTSSEAEYGRLLSKYLAEPRTLFVVSSDFCHWGTRFSYTYYTADETAPSQRLKKSGTPAGQPIFQSIEQVDRQGMDAISFRPSSGKAAKEAHATFAAYLQQTNNTVCGRHPIGVLLGAATALQEDGTPGWEQDEASLSFVRYEQSSQCKRVSDSSVSYASAILRTK